MESSVTLPGGTATRTYTVLTPTVTSTPRTVKVLGGQDPGRAHLEYRVKRSRT